MNEQKNDILKGLKAVVFDGDGVFFTGRATIDGEGKTIAKERNFVDGQGISMLRDIGLRILFITAEKDGFLSGIIDSRLNKFPSVENGRWKPIEILKGSIGQNKTAALDRWRTNQCEWNQIAYMGDDLGDLHVMKTVGFAAAPAQAEEEIKSIADFTAVRRGGDGAIRDFANFILKVRGVDPTTLNLQ